MRVFRLHSEGYIDGEAEFEYKQLMSEREMFPLLHDHDYYEFFLITNGSIQHKINDRTSILQKGHLVFIRPTDYHIYSKNGPHDCQMVNIAIMAKTIEELMNYLGGGLDRKLLLESDLPPMVLLTQSELSTLLARLERLNTLPVMDKVRLNTELRIILIHIFSNYFLESREKHEATPEWLRVTISKMQKPENFKRGMDAVKEIACRSDEHISRSFKKYLGKTPTQFVNEMRLNYAANQIRFSHKKIADIAFESGFDNQSNFHRQFKSFLGFTPNEFRKMNYKELTIM